MKYVGKRLRSLFSVATVPTMIVTAISDFLSPIGGWLIALFLGFSAVVLLLYWGWKSRAGRPPLPLERALSEDSELSWWFDGSGVVGKHAAHVLGVFAVFCLLVGFSSHAKAGKGGIAASAVPAVASLQSSILDELKENTAEQRRTTAAVVHVGDVVKRETSENPRKELQNRGVSWTHQNFSDAILNHDTETLDLFVAGGTRLESNGMRDFPLAIVGKGGASSMWMSDPTQLRSLLNNDVYTFFSSFDPAVTPLLARATPLSAQVCMIGDPQLRMIDALLDNKDKLEAYRQICASPEVVGRLKQARDALAAKLHQRSGDIVRCKTQLRTSLKKPEFSQPYASMSLASRYAASGQGGAEGALAYVLNYEYQSNGRTMVDHAGRPMVIDEALAKACDKATSPYKYGSVSPDLKLFDKYLALFGSGERRM